MARPRLAFLGTTLASLAAAAWLAGCAVFSPLPLVELTKAGAGATSMALSYGPSSARNTIWHEHETVSEVCIDVAPNTPDGDLVPALQAELARHDIRSRLYAAGATDIPAVAACRYQVQYRAEIGWDIPPLAGEYSPYLRAATLTLRSADGAVLSSSSYRLDGYFEIGKWSTSRTKIAPVVTALVTGFED
jgi:hypothetical protein